VDPDSDSGFLSRKRKGPTKKKEENLPYVMKSWIFSCWVEASSGAWNSSWRPKKIYI
jgi:hypothetical protein